MEFVEPRVRCVSSHGAFEPSRWRGREGPGPLAGHTGRPAGTHSRAPSSATCLPSRFPKPPQPIILRDCHVLPLPPGLPLARSQDFTPGALPPGPQPRPSTAVDPDVEPTLLRHPQVRAQAGRTPPSSPARTPTPAPAQRSLSLQGTVVFTTHVPALGRYAFLLHGYQPAHPTFTVEVLVSGGRVWQGEWQGRAMGADPRTRSQPVGGLFTRPLVWSSRGADIARGVRSQRKGPGPRAGGSPSLRAPFPDSLDSLPESGLALSHRRVIPGSPWDTCRRHLCSHMCVCFVFAQPSSGPVPSGPLCVATPDSRSASGPSQRGLTRGHMSALCIADARPLVGRALSRGHLFLPGGSGSDPGMRPRGHGRSVGRGGCAPTCLFIPLQATPTPASARTAMAAAPWWCVRARLSWM